MEDWLRCTALHASRLAYWLAKYRQARMLRDVGASEEEAVVTVLEKEDAWADLVGQCFACGHAKTRVLENSPVLRTSRRFDGACLVGLVVWPRAARVYK